MSKNIFSWIVLSLSLAFSIYLSSYIWGIQFIISIIIYWLIFYIAHILISFLLIFISNILNKNLGLSFNPKKPKPFLEFVDYFIYRISVFILVITCLFGSFVYYENYYEPALLPEFTLSNWTKTIVFQWMAHIWSDIFYNKIKANIIKNKKDWFVLFYEWVKAWSNENSKKFDQLIWFEFNKKTYTNLSKMYWLKAQNNNDFLNLVNNKDYNVDISMDEIIKKYEKKFWKINSLKPNNVLTNSPIKVDDLVNETLANINPRELSFLIQINRSVMNFIIKNENIRDTIMAQSWQKDIFWIILNDRNQIIIDSINNSSNNKIHILYWLMHFNWVWSELQSQDSNWKITNIKYFKPIE